MKTLHWRIWSLSWWHVLHFLDNALSWATSRQYLGAPFHSWVWCLFWTCTTKFMEARPRCHFTGITKRKTLTRFDSDSPRKQTELIWGIWLVQSRLRKRNACLEIPRDSWFCSANTCNKVDLQIYCRRPIHAFEDVERDLNMRGSSPTVMNLKSFDRLPAECLDEPPVLVISMSCISPTSHMTWMHSEFTARLTVSTLVHSCKCTSQSRTKTVFRLQFIKCLLVDLQIIKCLLVDSCC